MVMPLTCVNNRTYILSGTPAKLEIVKDSLSIRMQKQAFHLKAKVDTDLRFKIRLALGLDWGALGCMTTTKPCWDEEIKFATKINFHATFGIHWDDITKKIKVSVDTKELKFMLVLHIQFTVRFIRISIFQNILQRSQHYWMRILRKAIIYL